MIAYLRTDPSEESLFVVVGHFGGATRDYRIGVPRRGWWREVINTNSEYYGGSGLGNAGGRATDDEPRDGYTQSIDVRLPPLTTLVFKWSAPG
jgi:1,4-alpha-glucan branching enzyme